MTADIFGDAFVGRKPAWHGLGTIIPQDEPLTTLQALAIAKADYSVTTHPVGVEAYGTTFETGRVAIVREPCDRDPNPAILGYASKDYQVIQNRDIAAFMDDIAESQGWSVETVGALGKGETFFTTLRTSAVEIEGDGEVVIYFLAADGKNGGTAFRVATTPVRVVCQNTLRLGLEAATMGVEVAHVGDAHGEVRFSMDIIAQMQAAQVAVTDAMRLLARTPVSTEQVVSILDAAYAAPTPTKRTTFAQKLLEGTVTLDEARQSKLRADIARHDDWVRTVATYREAAMDRYATFNDEFPAVARTGWAIANAVAETEQYRRGRSEESRGRDMLWGDRGATTERAFQAALAVASTPAVQAIEAKARRSRPSRSRKGVTA